MSRPIEKLKKQLIEISEVVNAFQSEAVQVKVVDKLLDAMIEFERGDADGFEFLAKKTAKPKFEIDDYSNTNQKNRELPKYLTSY
ncbi:hypothetical protein [Mucilaginibacter antarcticus]|uniref:hypothetical protein n=1 Tax=Mucilaginibacter antarcticus TaxID=1855725 RepID=UPI00362872C6